MEPLNFKFVASTMGLMAKANIYSLIPVLDNTETKTGAFAAAGTKAPLVGSLYGRSVLMSLYLETKDGKQLRLDESVVTITRSKNIVSTQVVGGRGTVKEYIGDNDLSIDITVGIVAVDSEGNITDEYPFDGVAALKEILDKNEAIKACSYFFDLFEINGGEMNIVVTEYTIEQQTHSNRQVVSIKAVSDYDYTIYSEEA